MVKVVVIDKALRLQHGALAAEQKTSPKGVVDSAKTQLTSTSRSSPQGQLLKFRLPCDFTDRLFLYVDNILYELQCSTLGNKTSWFLNNEVVQEGSFYIATPFQVNKQRRNSPFSFFTTKSVKSVNNTVNLVICAHFFFYYFVMGSPYLWYSLYCRLVQLIFVVNTSFCPKTCTLMHYQCVHN